MKKSIYRLSYELFRLLIIENSSTILVYFSLVRVCSQSCVWINIEWKNWYNCLADKIKFGIFIEENITLHDRITSLYIIKKKSNYSGMLCIRLYIERWVPKHNSLKRVYQTVQSPHHIDSRKCSYNSIFARLTVSVGDDGYCASHYCLANRIYVLFMYSCITSTL